MKCACATPYVCPFGATYPTQAPGLLFDVRSWTSLYERGLFALWDAASLGAPSSSRGGPKGTAMGQGSQDVAGMHVVVAGHVPP